MADPIGGGAGVRRDKLGLALSGGGFRASLFHLGVLRRMAELDILRDVETLSTVSGGSIIGALYVMLLKGRIDAKGDLTREDYLAIVEDAQKIFTQGMWRNLRLMLFMNPLGTLRVLLTEHSWGRRMSRLYERYLYREPVRLLDLTPNPRRKKKWWRPGYLSLYDTWFAPRGEHVKGIDRYNASHATKLPNLVLNATALNSGRSFRFSAAEIGDSRLGLFRWDEIQTELEPRKRLLETISRDELDRLASERADALHGYARWWRARGENGGAGVAAPFRSPLLPGPLAQAELGALRRVKIAAWYLARGTEQGTLARSGPEYDDWLERFWNALRRIDPFFSAALWGAAQSNAAVLAEAFECVLQIYYLRSAQAMSPRLRQDYEDLALAEAVGASACFPPAFPPFIILGIYDDAHVARLGLTDGGVYDNVGIATLLEDGCNYIIASDTGALLDVEQRVSSGRSGLIARIPGILMDRVGNLQSNELEDRRALTALDMPGDGLYGFAYFQLESAPLPGPGCTTGLDPAVLGKIRTDLDAFGEVEIAALVNHGYDVADRHLRAKLDQSPFVHDRGRWAPPQRPPMPLTVGERERSILRVASSLFFRSLKLGAWVSWAFVAALVVLAWRATRDLRLSVSDVMEMIADRAVQWIAGWVPYLGERLVSTPVPVFFAIVALCALVWLAIWGWNAWIEVLRKRHPGSARKLAFAAKWLRSHVMNVLWLLGLAPIWIALGLSAVTVAAYLFFTLPFLGKTKIR